MRPQRAAFGARQTPIELARDRKLRLAARQRSLELLAEGAAGPEEQRFDRRHGDLEDLRDLRIGPALELAHDDRRALVEREVAERALDVLRARPALLLGREVTDLVVELDLVGSARGLPEALPADVVRDRDQPVLGVARPLTTAVR